ncbi:MAG TPA: hypothetical protein VF814_19870 [Casimicrobiaceae bacterium]
MSIIIFCSSFSAKSTRYPMGDGRSESVFRDCRAVGSRIEVAPVHTFKGEAVRTGRLAVAHPKGVRADRPAAQIITTESVSTQAFELDQLNDSHRML